MWGIRQSLRSMCPLTFLQKFLGTLCLSSGDIHPRGSLLQGQLALQDGDAGQSSDDFSWVWKLKITNSAILFGLH